MAVVGILKVDLFICRLPKIRLAGFTQRQQALSADGVLVMVSTVVILIYYYLCLFLDGSSPNSPVLPNKLKDVYSLMYCIYTNICIYIYIDVCFYVCLFCLFIVFEVVLVWTI